MDDSSIIPFPAPAPAVSGEQPPLGRVDGGACPPGSPELFPAELAALAAYRAAELRMMSTCEWLDGLIGRTRDDAGDQSIPGVSAIAGAMLDPLLDLREALESQIVALGQKIALEEAVQMDHDFREMAPDVALEEFRQLRPDQKAALLWAQAKALAAAKSLVTAIGGDGEPPEAA